MSEKNEKKKKRGGNAVFLLLILIIAIILLLIWKGGFGFGLGGGNGTGTGSGDGNSDETVIRTGEALLSENTVTASETETLSENDGSTVTIIVTDGRITVNNEEYPDADSLKKYILSLDMETKTFILRDDKALKSAYDEAKSVLDELELEYTEEIS